MAAQQMSFGSLPVYAPPQGSPAAPAYPYNPQGVASLPATGVYPLAGQPPSNFPSPPPIPNAPPVGEPLAPSVAKVPLPGARELMQVGDDPQRALRRTSNKRMNYSYSHCSLFTRFFMDWTQSLPVYIASDSFLFFAAAPQNLPPQNLPPQNLRPQNLPPPPPQLQPQTPYSLQRDLEGQLTQPHFVEQPPDNVSSSGWAGAQAAASLRARTSMSPAAPPPFSQNHPAASPSGQHTLSRAAGVKPPACPPPGPPGVAPPGPPAPAPKAVGAPSGAPTFLPGLNPKLIAKLKKQGLIELPGDAEQQQPPEAPSRPEGGILRFSQLVSPPVSTSPAAARAPKPVAPPASLPPPVPFPTAPLLHQQPQGTATSFEPKPPPPNPPRRPTTKLADSFANPPKIAPLASATSSAGGNNAGGKRSSLAAPSKAPPPPPISSPPDDEQSSQLPHPQRRPVFAPEAHADAGGGSWQNGKQQPYAPASSLAMVAADCENEQWFFNGTRDEAEAALLARTPLQVSCTAIQRTDEATES